MQYLMPVEHFYLDNTVENFYMVVFACFSKQLISWFQRFKTTSISKIIRRIFQYFDYICMEKGFSNKLMSSYGVVPPTDAADFNVNEKVTLIPV